ncbi:Flp family type IVb pilin [Noviherbaspirillum sedimenti]|uniref:Flp family type IVb pilin n=1 Tax=Noviherbaspirillum sedimenti TaxID=2320865 RepID=A0A3A3GA76_9BURK|nr:Flp family type IVb pilin [Noviherbaspirillum sedimenti]RJG03659.1 Flp family type IVb pilin [Noviherbaspirillum sedimenti]
MRLHRLRNLVASEDAVTAIEYALLAALIAVVILGSVTLVGSRTLDLYQRVSNCVDFAVTGNGNCS